MSAIAQGIAAIVPDRRVVCATCTQQLVLACFFLETARSVGVQHVGCLAVVCQLRCTDVRTDRANADFRTVIVPVVYRMHLSFVCCDASAANVMYMSVIAGLTCVRNLRFYGEYT